MSRVVLSIGSNLGDRLGHLRLVTAELDAELIAVSAVYETAPWGGVEQQDFLNAVLVADAAGHPPRWWLDRAQELEQQAARERLVRWGPRTLDVDIVHIDGVTSDDPELTLPHPRAHERAFVLLPWLDADPAATLPGHGEVAGLVAGLSEADRAGARRRADLSLRTG